jgi:quercetin 2,3-dioxygenase
MSSYRQNEDEISVPAMTPLKGRPAPVPHTNSRNATMSVSNSGSSPIRSIRSIHPLPVGLNRPTIVTRDVTPDVMGDAANPFIIASLFEMSGPTFPPHPHAGFTVATYLLPESEGAFINQDSTGFANRIAPGGLHATIAGTGVLHEETNEIDGQIALGFQIWINMTAENRNQAPRPVSLEPADVPVHATPDHTIRVLAGTSNGLTSPLNLPTAIRLVDVDLKPGALFHQTLEQGERAFLWMVGGEVSVNGAKATALQAASLGDDGSALIVEAGADGARFMLFAGQPIQEPLVQGGPFVGSSEAEIQGYFAAARSGRMGSLVPFAQQRQRRAA